MALPRIFTKHLLLSFKAVTNQIVDLERRLRLANERHYYASAECLLLARLTALAGVVNVLLRYVLVLRYDRLKLVREN